MAQHPSLRSKEKGKQHRSVLKRFERIKGLKEKEKWKEGDSVFGLPKLKILKFKLKKEKAEVPTEATEGLEGAPAKEEQAKEVTSGGKGAVAKKEAPKKEEKKKEAK